MSQSAALVTGTACCCVGDPKQCLGLQPRLGLFVCVYRETAQ